METIKVIAFNPYDLSFPVFAITRKRDQSTKSIRFLGTSVCLIKEENKIITCKHLFDSLSKGEALGICINQRMFDLVEVKTHPSIDILVAKINNLPKNPCLIDYSDFIKNKPLKEYNLGLKIRAFGYTVEHSNSQCPEIFPEVRYGYISLSTSEINGIRHLGANSRRELSFLTPNGFSGGPVLIDSIEQENCMIPVGIMYNNRESELNKWELTNVEEGGTKYVESKLQIEGHSLFHSLDDIAKAINEMGINIK